MQFPDALLAAEPDQGHVIAGISALKLEIGPDCSIPR
jgi:hypothetical protein